MPAKLVSFRLPDAAVEALEIQALPGDSLNLTAQRVLLEALGLSTVDKIVDRNATDGIVDKIVDSERFGELLEEKLTSLVNSVNGLLTGLEERIENLEKLEA